MSTNFHNHYEDLVNLNIARKELKKPQIETKRRNCLRCDKPFDSTGSGNRICTKCKQEAHHIGIGYGDLELQRNVSGRSYGCSSTTRSK